MQLMQVPEWDSQSMHSASSPCSAKLCHALPSGLGSGLYEIRIHDYAPKFSNQADMNKIVWLVRRANLIQKLCIILSEDAADPRSQSATPDLLSHDCCHYYITVTGS